MNASVCKPYRSDGHRRQLSYRIRCLLRRTLNRLRDPILQYLVNQNHRVELLPREPLANSERLAGSEFEDGAFSQIAPSLMSGAVEYTALIPKNLTCGISSVDVAASAETIQCAQSPSRVPRTELEYRTVSVVASLGGRAVEISCTIESECAFWISAKVESVEHREGLCGSGSEKEGRAENRRQDLSREKCKRHFQSDHCVLLSHQAQPRLSANILRRSTTFVG